MLQLVTDFFSILPIDSEQMFRLCQSDNQTNYTNQSAMISRNQLQLYSVIQLRVSIAVVNPRRVRLNHQSQVKRSRFEYKYWLNFAQSCTPLRQWLARCIRAHALCHIWVSVYRPTTVVAWRPEILVKSHSGPLTGSVALPSVYVTCCITTWVGITTFSLGCQGRFWCRTTNTAFQFRFLPFCWHWCRIGHHWAIVSSNAGWWRFCVPTYTVAKVASALDTTVVWATAPVNSCGWFPWQRWRYRPWDDEHADDKNASFSFTL